MQFNNAIFYLFNNHLIIAHTTKTHMVEQNKIPETIHTPIYFNWFYYNLIYSTVVFTTPALQIYSNVGIITFTSTFKCSMADGTSMYNSTSVQHTSDI
jgi:hypothetical protein